MKYYLVSLIVILFSIPVFGQHNELFKFPKTLSSQDYDQSHVVIKLAQNQATIHPKQLQELKKLGLTNPTHLFSKPANLLHASTQRQKMNQLGMQAIYKVSVAASSDLATVINQLRAIEWIRYVEPLYHHQVLIDPNTLDEPFVSFHWGHADSKIYDVWDSTFGDPDVVIGVIDAGCKTDHPSLINQFYYNDAERFGVDGVDDDGNGYVDDSLGYDFIDRDGDVNLNISHGTEVAGVIAAELNDNLGSYGAAPSCRIMPMNISSASGILANGYEAIVYAAENGCDIINLSWGRVGGASQLEQDVINMVVETYDVIIVAAAGNTAAELDFYPASYDNVLSVAHISEEHIGIATHSDFIDLAAPGVQMPSTTLGGGIDGNGHTVVTGSSYASPFVASVAALLKSHYPDLLGTQISELIRHTANPDIYDVPINMGKAFGMGRLDALQAFAADRPAAIKLLTSKFQNEGDIGIMIPGNTIELICDFVNYLEPSTADFYISLSTEATGITMIDSVLAAGIINTLDTASNQNQPFKFQIAESLTVPKNIEFTITYHYPNREDYQYLTLPLENTSASIVFNRLATTVDANGRIGYTGNGLVSNGIGFRGDEEHLLNAASFGEVGLVIAANENQVLDCIFDDQGGKSADFAPLAPMIITENTDSLLAASGKYGDFRSSNPIGLSITQETRGWREGRENYLVLRYAIENTSDEQLDSLQIGLFANWSILDGLNHGQWDELGNFGYIADTDRIVAIKALSSTERFQLFAMDGSVAGVDLTDGFSKAEKYTALTADNKSESRSEEDLAMMTSQTIYNIPAQSQREVAFLILSDFSLEAVREAMDSVPVTLIELYSPTPPELSDTLFCTVDALELRPDVSGDYRFYADADLTDLVDVGEALTVSLADTGKLFYITNAALPLESSPIAASAHLAVPVVDFSMPDSIDLDTEPSLPLTNLTGNWEIASYQWDFGDGTTSTAVSPQKVYDKMGHYTVKQVAIAAGVGCIDSLSKSFTAYRSTYLPEVTDQTICLGNDALIEPLGGSNFNFYQFEDGTSLLASGTAFNVSNVVASQTIYVSVTDSVFESPLVPVELVSSSITARFTAGPERINAFLGDTLYLEGSEAAQWEWDFGNGESSNLQHPYVIYENAGTYNVRLIASNEFACSDTASQQINVISEVPVWTEAELLAALIIYPNPSEQLMNIDLASSNYKDLDLVIIAATGHQVNISSYTRADGLIELDFQGIPKGLYLLKISVHGATVTKRIVLQ